MISKSLYACLIGVFLSTRMSYQASTATSPFYVGAVVEYYPFTHGKNEEAPTNDNGENFLKILKTASENDVDIIVLPENGLMAGDMDPNKDKSGLFSTYMPSPDEKRTPCTENSTEVIQMLKKISCAARQYRMYVVMNINEKVKCEGNNNSSKKYDFYNTNIVFDRSGTLVAKYRKFNLFAEPFMTPAPEPQISTFKSDFGVTFGLFICFDILFEKPSLDLVRKEKVTDIVYSVHWFMELPFMNANAVHTAWSLANNVNLLASGGNDPKTGSGNTGINIGTEGNLGRIYSDKKVNAMVVSKIPKLINGKRTYPVNPADTKIINFSPSEVATISGDNPKGQAVLFEEDLSLYTTSFLQPKQGVQKLVFCNRGLCCNFVVNALQNDTLMKDKNAKYYRYRFAVFKGVRSYLGQGSAALEVCSIIACADEKLASCSTGSYVDTDVAHSTTFTSIEITGNFTKDSENFHLPLSFNTNLHPLKIEDIDFTRDDSGNPKYALKTPHGDLKTFAIYGRNYPADKDPITKKN